MPVLTVSAKTPTREQRARLAQDVTNAVVASLPHVPAEKIQVFFDPPTDAAPAVEVRMIGPAPLSLGSAIADAIGDPTTRVTVRTYAPDETARGGQLREASGPTVEGDNA